MSVLNIGQCYRFAERLISEIAVHIFIAATNDFFIVYCIYARCNWMDFVLQTTSVGMCFCAGANSGLQIAVQNHWKKKVLKNLTNTFVYVLCTLNSHSS